jgi:plasmid maintenance system antidote protein VapI
MSNSQFGSENAFEGMPLDSVTYNPDVLLNELQQRLGLRNDAALSRALEVAPPVISKIRHRRLPVGASLLIRMHEVSEISIRDLRNLMGDRRAKFRMSDKSYMPKDLNRDANPPA